MTAATIMLTVVPSIGLFLYFYKSDLHPEPRGVLIKTFVLGVLSILPACIVAAPLMLLIKGTMLHPGLYGLYVAFLCAALPEEGMKFLVLTRYSIRTSAYDELALRFVAWISVLVVSIIWVVFLVRKLRREQLRHRADRKEARQ